MKKELKQILEKQRYAVVGDHSGVKLCHWMRQSLLYDRPCYKQVFYGIPTHRCLQMTPSINHCTHMCLFCWRFQQFNEQSIAQPDEPAFILDRAIEEQQRLITGFKGDDRCDQNKWKEANQPTMVACSLSGEPTIYPRLGEFFAECKRRGMTTFLVTNGTQPAALAQLDTLPDQLYVSLIAPNKTVYKKLCVPLIPDGWDRIQQTLELLPSLDTRTVIRHTLLQDWNMNDAAVKQFSTMLKKAEPLFIEPKGYVFVGYSRQRLTLANMPSHDQVKTFGQNLAENLGYHLRMERPDSRVVLLTQSPSTNPHLKKMEK